MSSRDTDVFDIIGPVIWVCMVTAIIVLVVMIVSDLL